MMESGPNCAYIMRVEKNWDQTKIIFFMWNQPLSVQDLGNQLKWEIDPYPQCTQLSSAIFFLPYRMKITANEGLGCSFMQSLSIDLNIWAVEKYKFYNGYLNNISVEIVFLRLIMVTVWLAIWKMILFGGNNYLFYHKLHINLPILCEIL